MKSVKRRYLQALPYYISERDKRREEIEHGSRENSKERSPTGMPLPTFDAALDPEAIVRAEVNRRKFEQLYAEVWQKKKDHLEKMQASEFYKRKAGKIFVRKDRTSMMS